MSAASAEDAAARVRRRLREWVEREGHGSKIRLAEAVSAKYGEPKSPAWVTGILMGPDKNGQDLRLRDLDAVAEFLGVPPGDLVRREGDLYVEVLPTEMRFLRHVRALPDTARHHWIAFLDYVFGFQERLIAEQKGIVDGRTKAARLVREQPRPNAENGLRSG